MKPLSNLVNLSKGTLIIFAINAGFPFPDYYYFIPFSLENEKPIRFFPFAFPQELKVW